MLRREGFAETGGFKREMKEWGVGVIFTVVSRAWRWPCLLDGCSDWLSGRVARDRERDRERQRARERDVRAARWRRRWPYVELVGQRRSATSPVRCSSSSSSSSSRAVSHWRRLTAQLRHSTHQPGAMIYDARCPRGWLGSRVVSVLDSGAEGPAFKSQPRRCRVTVLGKLFTPIVPLFTNQRNW